MVNFLSAARRAYMSSMKVLLLTVLIILVNINRASAAQVGEYKDKAGITAKHFFYFVDKGMEELKIKDAKGEEEKIDLFIDIAQERLAEAIVLLNEGEENYGIRTINDFGNALKRAQNTFILYAKDNIQNFDITLLPISERLNNFTKESLGVLGTMMDQLSSKNQMVVSSLLEGQLDKVNNLNSLIAHRTSLKSLKRQLTLASIRLNSLSIIPSQPYYDEAGENYKKLFIEYAKELKAFYDIFNEAT